MTRKPTEPPLTRSEVMRRVKGADTSIEMTVRRLSHRLGYRFRLHRKDLPGSPDLVFPGRRKVIFVHGCFWHGHDCPRGSRVPKTNRDYWLRKIERNVRRDASVLAELDALGWTALTIWECEMKDTAALQDRIAAFLA